MHPRHFARRVSTVLRGGSRRSCRHLILPFIAIARGLGPAWPCQAGQGAGRLSPLWGMWLQRPSPDRGSWGGQSAEGPTIGICGQAALPNARQKHPQGQGQTFRYPLCVPRQCWGYIRRAPPARAMAPLPPTLGLLTSTAISFASPPAACAGPPPPGCRTRTWG